MIYIHEKNCIAIIQEKGVVVTTIDYCDDIQEENREYLEHHSLSCTKSCTKTENFN